MMTSGFISLDAFADLNTIDHYFFLQTLSSLDFHDIAVFIHLLDNGKCVLGIKIQGIIGGGMVPQVKLSPTRWRPILV